MLKKGHLSSAQSTPVAHCQLCVSQVKGTVLLMPNGSDRVTIAPLQTLQTEKAVVDEELKKLLASSLKTKKKTKKKGKGEKVNQHT